MENKKERNKTVEVIIKILIVILIILLLIHHCGLLKGKPGKPGIIDIDCTGNKCSAILKDLTVSPTDIDFKSDAYTYNIEVDANTDEIVINAMPFDPSTKVSIPGDLKLKEGLNTFTVTATTKDGKKVTYTINVTKKDNDNKVVKNIKVSPKNISFNEDIHTYNIKVGNSVKEIGIEVIPFDSSTKVSIPSDLSLKEGLNTFNVKVTTKDGKELTYTIKVTRAKKSEKNPILKELTVSPVGIDFKESKHTYDIEVDSNVNEVVINALPYDSSTKVIIPSDLTLKEGMNTFTVEVITKDGKKETYTINVNKKGKDEKVIKDITVGPTDIEFKEDEYTYDIEVDNNVTEITLSALPFDKDTDVVITPSDLSLQEGLNTFKVEATNKDGIKKVYTINVTRKGKDNKVIKDITISPKDIDFNEEVYTYDIEVDNDVTSITINAEAYSSTTTIEIPSNLSLNVGLNTFKVEGTNKDGIKKVYTIIVTRKGEGLIVRDSNITWTEATSVEIFENPLYDRGKIIAPESSNTYQFEIKNSTGFNIKYDIEFTESNPYNINLKYKLKKNDTYLVSEYSSVSELNTLNQLLDMNESDTYYLEWKWISSSNDTSIGESGDANYSLKIDVKAEGTNG